MFEHNSCNLVIVFKMGQVVDHAVDFYSSRVPKKQRKQTILEELIEDAQVKK